MCDASPWLLLVLLLLLLLLLLQPPLRQNASCKHDDGGMRRRVGAGPGGPVVLQDGLWEPLLKGREGQGGEGKGREGRDAGKFPRQAAAGAPGYSRCSE